MSIMDSIANTRIKVVVKKDGKNVYKPVRLGDIFSIDETNISEELAKQAGLYAYFATQMAYAEHTQARAAISKDASYADADDYYRKELAYDFKATGRKLTEAVVRAAVIQDEDYQTAAAVETRAKLDYRLLRVLCQALEMRATMLQSLGAHLRHELDMTGMNIRDRQYQAQISDVKRVITNARLAKK